MNCQNVWLYNLIKYCISSSAEKRTAMSNYLSEAQPQIQFPSQDGNLEWLLNAHHFDEYRKPQKGRPCEIKFNFDCNWIVWLTRLPLVGLQYRNMKVLSSLYFKWTEHSQKAENRTVLGEDPSFVRAPVEIGVERHHSQHRHVEHPEPREHATVAVEECEVAAKDSAEIISTKVLRCYEVETNIKSAMSIASLNIKVSLELTR